MAKGKAQGVRSGLSGEKKVKNAKSNEIVKAVRVKRTARTVKEAPVKGVVNVGIDIEDSSINDCSLFLHLTATNGILELSYEVPVQTMTVVMTRCHFKTLQNAQTYPAIGIVISLFSTIQLNNNLSSAVIPIMGDYSKVDVLAYPRIPLTMGKFLPRRPSFRVVDLTTNETIPDGIIDFIQLLFAYDTGVIN